MFSFLDGWKVVCWEILRSIIWQIKEQGNWWLIGKNLILQPKRVQQRGANIEAEQCRMCMLQLLYLLLLPPFAIIAMPPLCAQLKSHLLTMQKYSLSGPYHCITSLLFLFLFHPPYNSLLFRCLGHLKAFLVACSHAQAAFSVPSSLFL